MLFCHSFLEEEAYPVSSSPRRSQPKRDVGTNPKGAKGMKRSVSNKSSHLAAESNEEPNRDEENQKVKRFICMSHSYKSFDHTILVA